MRTEPISIMIIESHHLMRTALSTAISAEGMAVLAELSESRDAMQVAKKLNPELILFSVGNPSLADFKKISALREELPFTSILALVTGEFRGQEQAALEYGAHAVLTKTASRSTLLHALRSMSSRLQ